MMLSFPRRRRAGMVAGLATGLQTAWRYRRQARQVGEALGQAVAKVRAGMKRRGPGRVMKTFGSKRRRIVSKDPASYRQLVSIRRKFGRRLSKKSRDFKLMQTVTTPIRFRFGWVTDISENFGKYWLTQQQRTADEVRMPVYLCNLFTLSQLANSVADQPNFTAIPFFELIRNSTNGVYSWGPVPGIDPTDGTSPAYSKKRISPTEVADHVLGRKALLDWTRIRLCLWGKTRNPSNIRIRLIRFLDEEFCPEQTLNRTSGYTTAGTSFPKVNEYWESVCKYLVNGPQGGQPRADRKKYVKVLKEYLINFNPIDAAAETVESDPRPHMKHIDIFNRWGRMLDYTEPVSNQPTITNLRNVNLRDPVSREYSGYLRDPTKAVYLYIDSVQPDSTPTATSPSGALPRDQPTNGVQYACSFDMSVESNYSVIEKAL